VETALSAARGVLQQVREAREGWSRGLEENLVALATAVARHLVQRELRADPQAYQALVHEAVTSFPPDQAVRVRIHPEDLAMLAGLGDGKVPGDEAHGGREARWISDADVAPGGCIVEGPDRIVDGRVDRALERVFRELTHG
jgi:flagellar biosynthesis/type III secretory pathway protein FliH